MNDKNQDAGIDTLLDGASHDAGIKQEKIIERNSLTVHSITHHADGVDIVPDGCEYRVSHSDGDSDVAQILFQNGPVSDNGINGLTSEVLLETLIHRTAVLDGRFPCHENKMALKSMKEALVFFDMRTKRRQKEGNTGKMIEGPQVADIEPMPHNKTHDLHQLLSRIADIRQTLEFEGSLDVDGQRYRVSIDLVDPNDTPITEHAALNPPKRKAKKPRLIACGLAAIGAVSLILGLARH
jgi:hypothetical protein